MSAVKGILESYWRQVWRVVLEVRRLERDRLTVRLNPELKNQLKELAESEDRTTSNLVVRILDRYVQLVDENKKESEPAK
jgi:predicted DNA-binding ribbon-helix-helix protein